MKIIRRRVQNKAEQYVVAGVYLDQDNSVFIHTCRQGFFINMESGRLEDPFFPITYCPNATLRLFKD